MDLEIEPGLLLFASWQQSENDGFTMVWNIDPWAAVRTVGPSLWLSLNRMVSK